MGAWTIRTILLLTAVMWVAVAPGPLAAAQVARHGGEPVRLSEDSTLSDYLAYAALKNPELEAAFLR